MDSTAVVGAHSARHRLSERISAAAYGTVLLLATYPVIDADDVDSGLGWELIAGVGIATWLAHLFAEMLGDRLRHDTAPAVSELRRAMVDGFPIPLAALAPGTVLLLGRLDVLGDDVALWASFAMAIAQLVGLGAFVGWRLSGSKRRAFVDSAITLSVGLAVVVLKLVLGH